MTGMFINLEVAEERQAQVRREIRAINGRFYGICGERGVCPDELRAAGRAGVLSATLGGVMWAFLAAGHLAAAVLRGRQT